MACKDCGKTSCTCGKNHCAPAAAVQITNPSQLVVFRKVLFPASAGDETTNPPRNGAYCNVLLVYEATNATYLYSSDGIPTRLDADVSGLQKAIDDEVETRSAADQEIWTEIETIEASSDVVDVVGTYAELQAYDTSKLHANDLIKVLADETRDDAITYYRWSGTAFTYVGAEGPYYTASETDVLLSGKQDTLIAGTGITIASDGKTISSTTYSAGTGIDLTGTTFSVDDTVAMMTDIPDTTSDLTNNGADGTSVYVEADELATVATTGDYDDLLNKPSIPAAQVQADWGQTDNTQVDYIKNKPAIPDAQIQSDWNQADTTKADYIKNKPTIPAPYVLPTASANDLGGIKVGTNLSIDANGVLSASIAANNISAADWTLLWQ